MCIRDRYLGGPLTFLSELRKSFDTALNVTGIFPENSLYFVALGTAYGCSEEIDLDKAIDSVKNYTQSGEFLSIPPLFQSQEEYEEFSQRHNKDVAKRGDIANYPVSYTHLDVYKRQVFIVVPVSVYVLCIWNRMR